MSGPTDPQTGPDEGDVARLRLVAFARQHGRSMPPGTFVGDGMPGECWTNAWQADGAYVEGVTVRPNGRVGTHAWNLDADGRVVEHTPLYDDIVEYIGIVIDRDSEHGRLATRVMAGDRWRSSVLETSLVGIGEVATLAMLNGTLRRSEPTGNRAQRRAAKRGRR